MNDDTYSGTVPRPAEAPSIACLTWAVAALLIAPVIVTASPQPGQTALRIETPPLLLVGAEMGRSPLTSVAVRDMFHPPAAPTGAAPVGATSAADADRPAPIAIRLRASAAYSNGVIHFHIDPEPRRLADGALWSEVLVEHY